MGSVRKIKDWVGRAGIRGRIEARGKKQGQIEFLTRHSGLQAPSEIAKGKKK